MRLFRIRAFSASLGTYFLGIFVVVGYFLFISQYLQLVLGLSPLNAALWSLPSAVGFIVGSTIAPRIIHRFRPSVIMGIGMAVAAIGTAMLLGLSVDGDGGLMLIAAASVVISLGLAPVITLATELIVGSAPPEQAGAATGMSETSGELGGALGIAILGSLGTAVYRAGVADASLPDIPAEVADAARDTLGGALAIAGQKNPPQARYSAHVLLARSVLTSGWIAKASGSQSCPADLPAQCGSSLQFSVVSRILGTVGVLVEGIRRTTVVPVQGAQLISPAFNLRVASTCCSLRPSAHQCMSSSACCWHSPPPRLLVGQHLAVIDESKLRCCVSSAPCWP